VSEKKNEKVEKRKRVLPECGTERFPASFFTAKRTGQSKRPADSKKRETIEIGSVKSSKCRVEGGAAKVHMPAGTHSRDLSYILS